MQLQPCIPPCKIDFFHLCIREHGHGEYWDDVIYPSMKQSIIYTLLACQDSLEYRKVCVLSISLEQDVVL